MNWKLASATAAAVVFFASPANAADYRHCWTTVSDSNGMTKYMVVTEIFDAEPHPNFQRIWSDWSVSVAEDAMRKGGVNGQVKANCTDSSPDALQNLRTNRPKIFAALRKRGVVIQVVEPNFGPAEGTNAASGSASDSQSASRDTDETSSADSDRAGDSGSGRDANAAEKEKPTYVRVAVGQPPAGYSDWYNKTSIDFPPYVSVYWAEKVEKDEVRVLWRCVNESSVDVACSIGAGKDKTYHCELPGMRAESTRSLGERRTVRSGSHYTFPSDWACRGLGATGVRPDVAIRIESL